MFKSTEPLLSIGRQVLSDLGIHKIDPEKKYPFYIRRRIHDAVLERYGPEALYALGLSYGAGWQIHYDEINSLLAERVSSDQNFMSNVACLDIFINEFVSLSTAVLNKSNFEGIEYSMMSEVIDDRKFKFIMTTTSSITAEPFTRGYIFYGLHHSLSQFWNIDVEYLKEMTTSGDYWTKFIWIGSFSAAKHKNSSNEIARTLLSHHKEKLLGTVLDDVEKKNKLLMESIQYASLLQKGQLPRYERITNRFSSFSTIWEPRDTIGGDLFWLSPSESETSFFVTIADCTGHGVPGAMLSLLVSNLLERIYANNKLEDPAEALLLLDQYVRTGLNQDRKDSETDNGCDAAILKIDKSSMIIKFAGAKIDLLQVSSDGKVTRHKGYRVSLGYQDKIFVENKPLDISFGYEVGDLFALVTDGFTDQIGGTTGTTSYGYRRLEEILKTNCTSSAEEITTAMKSGFSAWQGTNARRDDVTAVVFRL